jgi:hypothetical protein
MTYNHPVIVIFTSSCKVILYSRTYLPLAETVNNSVCFLFFFFPPPCPASTASLVVGVVAPFALDAPAQPTGDVSLLPLILEIICDVSDLFAPNSACLSA